MSGDDGWVWVDAAGQEVPGIGTFGQDTIFYDDEFDAVWLFSLVEANAPDAVPGNIFQPWGEAHHAGLDVKKCQDGQVIGVDSPFPNAATGPAGQGVYYIYRNDVVLTLADVFFPIDNDSCYRVGMFQSHRNDFLRVPAPEVTWTPPLHLELH